MRADDIDQVVDCIEILCENPGEKFIMAYCDKPDGTLHKFGTDSEEAKEFLLDAEAKVKALCDKLSEDTITVFRI